MPDCLSNNPFRILGVYSNATARDIAANKSKLQAYLRVNREVVFPIDNVVSLPIKRDQTIVDNAISEINLSQDKIKHALFWFINGNKVDEMAIQHLAAGNADKFIELLDRKDDYATKVNKAVYELSVADYESAISDMTSMLHNDDDRDSFVTAVCGDAFSISEDDLAHLYIDELLENYPDQDWKQLFFDNGESVEDDDYITEKIVGKPINEITSEIAKAKSVDRNDASANLTAGNKLIDATKENLSLLKEILGTSDSQYQMVADKLALQILQNGINYFNNVDDYEGMDDAMKIQSYALRTAVGKVAKDRCNENVKILKDIKANLPPVSCRYHAEIINRNIHSAVIGSKTCDSAIKLIQDSYIYLQSIRAELGSTNDYYLRISTNVANVALGLVIDDFNATFNDKLEIALILDRAGTIAKAKSKCRAALTATLYMDQLDMQPDFRDNRYAKNKNSLKSQSSSIEVYVSSSVVKLDRRNEDEIFKSAKSVNAIDEYRQLFPKGKYISQCDFLEEKFSFQSCKTVAACERFKSKYPHSSFDIASKMDDCCFDQCKTLSDYRGYIASYPTGRHYDLAMDNILRLEFEACNSVYDYQSYIAKYPSSAYSQDAQKIISDENAWAKASSIDQKSAYKDYLAQFPNGRHKDVAQNKASACYIATMVYGDYNSPEVQVLRSFRDNNLRGNVLGERFIAFYYRNSPRWVEKMKEKKLVNSIIRNMLNIFVKLYSR